MGVQFSPSILIAAKNNMMTTRCIENIPLETLTNIVQYLPLNDELWNVAFVCQSFLEVVTYQLNNRTKETCNLYSLLNDCPSKQWIKEADDDIAIHGSLSKDQSIMLRDFS